jgi:hypothetical protein
MLRSIMLAFVWLPSVPAFAFQLDPSAVAHHEEIIDKALGIAQRKSIT